MQAKWKSKSIKDFAYLLHEISKSDRDNFIGVAGDTGGGKSTFMILLVREYEKITGVKWDFKYMTYKRKELVKWIDGEGDDKKDQVPEFTPIIADELVSMFFSRNWYETEQIEAIELFNKCRDRHLLIMGAVPVFWQLDKALLPRFRFYVYVPVGRNVAWVFTKNDNPFTTDQWSSTLCKNLFEKHRNPYSLPTFVYEVSFGDLSPEDKEKYLEIRNTRRVGTEGQRGDKVEKYRDIKKQRDGALRHFATHHRDLYSNKQLAEIFNISHDHVWRVVNGER